MKSLTYKGEIVQEYLIKFPNTPTSTLARMIADNYGVDFSYDSARSLIRTHRGEAKNNNLKNMTSVRTEDEKKAAMKKFAKTDYKPVKDFILPKSSNRGIIINDVHVPYHDHKALATVVDFALDYKPNFIYINGDFIDFYQLSRFVKDRRLRDTAGELEMARGILWSLKDLFDVPIYYKIGNHCDRLENYLRINAPELLGIEDFEIQSLLRFGEMGITKVESRQKCMMGKLAVFHGHEFGHQVFSPVNPARGLYMKAKHSSAVGHHHRTSEHTEKDIADEVTTTWSIGALCGLHPEYLPFNNWNHGFATIEIMPSGNYTFGNRKIIDGKIY
jgi:hypothetical protein